MSSSLPPIFNFFIELLVPTNMSGLSLYQFNNPEDKLLDSDIMDRVVNSSTFGEITSAATHNSCNVLFS